MLWIHLIWYMYSLNQVTLLYTNGVLTMNGTLYIHTYTYIHIHHHILYVQCTCSNELLSLSACCTQHVYIQRLIPQQNIISQSIWQGNVSSNTSDKHRLHKWHTFKSGAAPGGAFVNTTIFKVFYFLQHSIVMYMACM